MNLPNKLSMLRICMIPFFVAFAMMDAFWAQLLAVVIYIVACITDALDGHIARSRNLVTNFGKFMDPIADKLLVMSALIILVSQGRMPAWVCILMLAREFLISGFRLVAAETGKVIAAGSLGKLKTVFQMVSTIALLFFVPVGESTAILGNAGIIIANVLMYIAMVLTVISGADYILRNRDCIGDM
ncbi:MAG: CDP-diacylglycerol--glycerol-3-phosphate 3-phosphatidyltransferase [Clostridiales bacterium]|nr:CDP-diacylglycerol--glycerol-3-phosphate 3-phosphatidyltransferase [Clostridiales bacterium]